MDRAIDVAGEPREQRIGAGAVGRRMSPARPRRSTDRPAWRRAAVLAALRASLTGASMPVGISVPMQPRAHRDDRVGSTGRCSAGDRARAVEPVSVRPPRRQFPVGRDARRTSAPACRRRAVLERSRSRSEIHDAAGRPRSDRQSHSRSIWANSAPTRPRLSQTPRRISLDLGGDFSGNAAARLSRPSRCSGSQRPDAAHQRAAKFAITSGLISRIARSSATRGEPKHRRIAEPAQPRCRDVVCRAMPPA